MKDSFLTIASPHFSEVKIERSRFIGTAIPAGTRDEAESRYQQVCKQYYDATHNCFAFRCGYNEHEVFRYSDDGEPSGTAGRPIYDAIISHQLTNVLVVVTRYFGGIKLGTGGLARAYRQSADQVLDEAHRIEKLIMQDVRIRFDHDLTSVVMKVLSDFALKPVNTDYSDRVAIDTAIRLSKCQDLAETIRERSHGKARFETIGEPHV